jgi:hypothetical protein
MTRTNNPKFGLFHQPHLSHLFTSHPKDEELSRDPHFATKPKNSKVLGNFFFDFSNQEFSFAVSRMISRSGVCGLNFMKRFSFSASLPLTLTLSPAEREQPLDTSLKSRSGRVEVGRELAKTLSAFPPLPEGEGRGEGKRDLLQTLNHRMPKLIPPSAG